MNIKIIKSQTDYDLAIKQLTHLMDINPLPGSAADNDLELLALVIRDYERKNSETIEVDPVSAIKFRMEQMGLSRKELTPYLGSISKVSEILSGKRNLSLSMIRKLHEGLEIPLESLIVKKLPPKKKLLRKKKPVKNRRKLSLRKKRRKAVL